MLQLLHIDGICFVTYWNFKAIHIYPRCVLRIIKGTLVSVSTLTVSLFKTPTGCTVILKMYRSLKHFNKTRHMFRLRTEPSSGVFSSPKLHIIYSKSVISLVQVVSTVFHVLHVLTVEYSHHQAVYKT